MLVLWCWAVKMSRTLKTQPFHKNSVFVFLAKINEKSNHLRMILTFFLLFFFSVSQKIDFPFALVPVPSIAYVDDGEEMVTLTCTFNFPSWTNVSFEIQWFVNGNSSTPSRICDEPGNSCNTRIASTSNFRPRDQVIISRRFLCVF